ncbi:Uncharacterized protein SCF082_LOCUS16878 [Durusdinium trenchii]
MGSSSPRADRCEQQWCLWVVRIVFAGICLLTYKYQQQKLLKTPVSCPSSESFDSFWLLMRYFVMCYFALDLGSCFFCACSSRWHRQNISQLGRALSLLGAIFALWGLFLYGRAFTYHIRCVGIFGVVALICCFIFLCSSFIWCLAVECDFCIIEPGSEDVSRPWSCSCCLHLGDFFGGLDPWPRPPPRREKDLEAGETSPMHRDATTSVPRRSPPKLKSSPGGSSGKDESKMTFRVLSRDGVVVFAARSRQAIKSWVKRNLDREKRKGVLIEERPKSRRSFKKRMSPAGSRPSVRSDRSDL